MALDRLLHKMHCCSPILIYQPLERWPPQMLLGSAVLHNIKSFEDTGQSSCITTNTRNYFLIYIEPWVTMASSVTIPHASRSRKALTPPPPPPFCGAAQVNSTAMPALLRCELGTVFTLLSVLQDWTTFAVTLKHTILCQKQLIPIQSKLRSTFWLLLDAQKCF